MVIKRAVLKDAKDLAYVLCRSWQAAYKGIISPGDLAKNTDVRRRTDMFKKILSSENNNYIYLACDRGRPCGLCAFAISENSENAENGSGDRSAEIIAIYTLKEYWGKGLGQKLMARALSHIKQLGCVKVTLWVLEKNLRARRFYEKFGFLPDGPAKDSRLPNLAEFRYRLDSSSFFRD